MTELNKLFEETKYEEIINRVEASETEVDESFKQNLALSYFHTENYEKSTALFSEICKDSTDSLAWFNLCTSAILNNEERKGIDALNTAIGFNTEIETNGKGLPTPFMILYATYALANAGKYNLAFNQLNELAEIYVSLSITDSTFLYIRGVPFFDEFLKLAQKILPHQKVVSDLKNWQEYLSMHIDNEGKISLGEMIDNLMASKNSLNL